MTSRCPLPSPRASRSASSSSPRPRSTPASWDGETEALLMSAARRDHVVRLIEPALAAGQWVITDRFTDSTTAYQGHGRGVPLAGIEALHRLAAGSTKPDLTLILDLPIE